MPIAGELTTVYLFGTTRVLSLDFRECQGLGQCDC